MGAILQAGDEIDGFRVIDRLHAGGMAILYRVERCDEAGSLYVMKVPRLAQGEDAVAVVGLEVERMLLGAVSGPHLPRLVAVGDLARQPYLVTEWIDGPSLKDWLPRAPLAADEAAALVAPLAAALHDLHGRQLVHLDVKPSNVLYRREADGVPKEAVLVDLGISHHAQLPDLLSTAWQRPLGSAPYMAPEQVLGQRCDPRSDLFACGVILYELVTGRLPFGSPGSVGGLRERLFREPPPPRVLVPTVPAWMQEIILHCLEVEADRRYATAAQLAFDLNHGAQVAVGERGRRLRRQAWSSRLGRWFKSLGYEPSPCPPPTERLAAAPIVLVAVAIRHQDAAQEAALREAVRRLAAGNADYRIAVVTVVPPQPLLGSSRADETSGRVHIRHLVELRHWADPLGLPEARLTCHVLEDHDPVSALLDFARRNQVGQILIGAPPRLDGPERSLTRRPVAVSVAARVAMDASCTVSLVRP